MGIQGHKHNVCIKVTPQEIFQPTIPPFLGIKMEGEKKKCDQHFKLVAALVVCFMMIIGLATVVVYDQVYTDETVQQQLNVLHKVSRYHEGVPLPCKRQEIFHFQHPHKCYNDSHSLTSITTTSSIVMNLYNCLVSIDQSINRSTDQSISKSVLLFHLLLD